MRFAGASMLGESEMPDKTGFPTYDELMWPTLLAVRTLGGSGSNEEIVDKVVEIQGYGPRVQSEQHSKGNVSKLEYRAAWARTYLKFAGALESSGRGVWSLTKLGESIEENQIDELVRQAKKNQKEKRTLPDRSGAETYAEADVEVTLDWKEELLGCLMQLAPSDFERLCQRVLRESGFAKVEVTGKSGDGGIDGTGVLRMNLLSFHVLFQCKRYKGSVDAGTVRDFRGAMVGRADKGLILTTGSFTSAARREASRDGAPAIDLVDGGDFCDLLKSLKLGVAVEMVERVEVNRNWFASF
jgi:restriction system protein